MTHHRVYIYRKLARQPLTRTERRGLYLGSLMLVLVAISIAGAVYSMPPLPPRTSQTVTVPLGWPTTWFGLASIATLFAIVFLTSVEDSSRRFPRVAKFGCLLWLGVLALGIVETVIHRGHSARHGKLENGAYFLGWKGRYVEVCGSTFRTAMWIDAAFYGFMLSLVFLILVSIFVSFTVGLYKQTRPDSNL